MIPSCDIAIIGGGFTGLMATWHLVHHAPPQTRIIIFEPSAHLGYGLAYSTRNPHHLLNVRVKGMSALPDDPHHFLHWLASENGKSASVKLGLQTTWQADDFAPRALYALYLDDMAREILAHAKERGIDLRHIQHAVTALRQRESIYIANTDNGEKFEAKTCLLALGNLPAERAETPHTTSDIWSFDFARLKNETKPVAIIGTGLTMVDTVIALRDGGFKGTIIAASRNGLLPHVHDTQESPFHSDMSALTGKPQTLMHLMRRLRNEAAAAKSWQGVVNHWRHFVPALWAHLSTADKKKFLGRLFTLWGIHRHRMAPEIGRIIKTERSSGKLVIFSGGADIRSANGQTALKVGREKFEPAQIFDCRGPCYDVRKSGSPLMRQMLTDGLISPHETGWGIAIEDDFRVCGSQNLYAVGTLAIGARLETTAVPELRVQTKDVANTIRINLTP